MLLAASLAAQQQRPVFRSSVEVTSIDVGVVDERGRPVTDLRPEDFTVEVDDAPRRVVSAEWISLVTPPKPDLPPLPPEYSTNENSAGGRLIMLVVDQPNIRFGGAVVIRSAVTGFLDRLQPADRVAVIGLGPGGPPSTPFTSDRRRLQETAARMVGMRPGPELSKWRVTLSEGLAIDRGEPGALDRVLARECGSEPPGPQRDLCVSVVEQEAYRVVIEGKANGDMTMASLKALIEAVARIDAPKTLVLLTEGFLMADRLIDVQNLGSLAAAARTSIYALRLDEVMFSDVADRRVPMTRVEDRQETRVGVETLANAARGSLFNITVAADNAFARIEAEISGYYLLGVESVPTDKDGKPHPIEVSVRRSGTLVRSRRQVMTAGDLDHPRTPREAVMGALGSPMMLSTLPLIVAAFPLQGPDPAKVQLLLHASVGTDYTASKLVTFAYTITDAQGRIIESLGGDSRLNPLVNGVPSALQFDVTSSLPPGEYTVKLAVSESELVGSVEHVVQARLIDAAPVRLSDFIVGGPAQPGDLPRPTIGYVARFGNVHGYLEAYGPAVETLGVRYEVAADAKGPPLVSEEIQGRAAGPARTIFSKALLVRHLPPGKYVLRAILSTERGLLRTIAREFLLAGPPVLMTSATVSGGAAAPAVVYLPVKRELLSRAFRPEEALRPETVRAFRERVAPAARTTFDDGIALMSAKDYAKAERTFRIAIRTDTDSTAAMAYLGAVFAAAGYDTDAVSTWQTALVDGSDFPELYQWLGDTLMRTRNLGEARGLLEEAAAKWPSDLRFARPLSFLYATFGQGREALRTLTRYLSSTPNDLEALLIAVQWMYELHQTGAAAETRSEDVKTARGFASAYEKAKGPQTALVRQWMAFLEKPQK